MPEELRLLEHRDGPLRQFLEDLDAWDDDWEPIGPRPADYVRRGELRDADWLIAHGTYFDPSEFWQLRPEAAPDGHRVAVAFCPRTHARFGHAPHPYRALLEKGVVVCLGTDSLASSPSLSILDELRFLHRRDPSLSGELLLTMATLFGAWALRAETTTGSLRPGKSADLAIIPLPDRSDSRPPSPDPRLRRARPRHRLRGRLRHRAVDGNLSLVNSKVRHAPLSLPAQVEEPLHEPESLFEERAAAVPRRDLVVGQARGGQAGSGHGPGDGGAVVGPGPQQGRVVGRDQDPPPVVLLERLEDRADDVAVDPLEGLDLGVAAALVAGLVGGLDVDADDVVVGQGLRSRTGPWRRNRCRDSPWRRGRRSGSSRPARRRRAPGRRPR